MAGQDNIGAWHVQQMRLTAFTPVSQADRADSWWISAVGEPAETKTVRTKGAAQTLDGQWGKGRLVLNIDLGRTDWVAAAVTKVDEDLSEIPTLGAIDTVLDAFSSVTTKWLSDAPGITRLAWGAILVNIVENRVDGYKTLQKYLPSLKVDPDGSSDLLYQINRSRSSKVIEELNINRLQKWSVLALSQFNMQSVGAVPVVREARVQVSPALFACRLELDMNSQADRPDPLPATKLLGLYSELVALGKEISLKGDVA